MDIATRSHKRPRKDCKYNAEELSQILPHKEAFIKATTIPERLLILQGSILPAMFNYWLKQEKEPQDEEESRSWAKALTLWCSNNWRMKQGIARRSNNFRPRRAEVIWHNRRDDVLKAIAEEMGVAEVTTQTKGWFAARTPAIKKMISRMTDEEKAQLDAEIEKESNKGYNEQYQRRLAEKNHKKRIKQAMQDQFKEMGMTSIVFVAYTRVDGKLVVDAFDQTAELMRTASASFLATYPDEVKNMKLLILNYMKVLRTRKSLPALPFGIGNDPGQPKVNLEKTPAGYPVLPNPLPCGNWGKSDWEDLFTMYFGGHYALASGGKAAHVPYTEIRKRQTKFIQSKYLPKKATVKQPRNLSKASIEEIFTHIAQRQERYGPQEAFRFKAIFIKGELQPTQYPDPRAVLEPITNSGPSADADANTAIYEEMPSSIQATKPFTRAEADAYPPDVQTDNVHESAEAVFAADVEPHKHYNAAGIHNDPQCTRTTFVIVDQQQADSFHSLGMPMPVSCNGPANGPSRYPIPCSVFNGLTKYLPITAREPRSSSTNMRPTEVLAIDPALLDAGPMPTLRQSPSPGPNPRAHSNHKSN